MDNPDRELLTILCEESSEVQKEICKALRHGLDSRNPNDPESATNRQNIGKEIGDFLALVDLLTANGILSQNQIGYWRNSKIKRMKPYIHFNHHRL